MKSLVLYISLESEMWTFSDINDSHMTVLSENRTIRDIGTSKFKFRRGNIIGAIRIFVLDSEI